MFPNGQVLVVLSKESPWEKCDYISFSQIIAQSPVLRLVLVTCIGGWCGGRGERYSPERRRIRGKIWRMVMKQSKQTTSHDATGSPVDTVSWWVILIAQQNTKNIKKRFQILCKKTFQKLVWRTETQCRSNVVARPRETTLCTGTNSIPDKSTTTVFDGFCTFYRAKLLAVAWPCAEMPSFLVIEGPEQMA